MASAICSTIVYGYALILPSYVNRTSVYPRLDVLENTKQGLEMQGRRFRMLSACRNKSTNWELNIDYNGLFLSKNEKVLYCGIPKVGCSFWKRVFYVMDKQMDISPLSLSGTQIHISGGIKKLILNKVHPFDRHKAALTSVKFMFTRNPYRRMFSAYCDKLFVPTYVQSEIYTMVERKRKVANKTSVEGSDLQLAMNMSFAQSIIYASGSLGIEVDIHFKPTHDLCSPCAIHYDFIGKMETFDSDTAFILTQLNHSKILDKMGDVETNGEKNIIIDITKRTFLALKNENKHIKAMTPDNVLRRLWKLFQFRGFIPEREIYPFASMEEGEEVTSESFELAALEAARNFISREEKKHQREYFYLQAFRSVPLQVLLIFRESVRTDCEIFDYDCSPPEIFRGRRDGDEERNIFSDDSFLTN